MPTYLYKENLSKIYFKKSIDQASAILVNDRYCEQYIK